MKTGDLLRVTRNVYLWPLDRTNANQPTKELRKGDTVLLLEDNSRLNEIKVLTRLGTGWVYSAFVEMVR